MISRACGNPDICLTDIGGDLSFCPSKITFTTKTKCYYSEMEKYVLVILILLLKLAGCDI